MTFTELDATRYEYNGKFYNAEFEFILTRMILCYYLMLKDGVRLPNDENKIRDVLMLKYLNNNRIRKDIGLIDYLFDREVPENTTQGRTDLKIQSHNTFSDTDAYFIIECKRLDDTNITGVNGLNGLYVGRGMSRFASGTYSSYYKVNGMIGFVVKQVDIDKNIEFINKLLVSSFSNIKTIGIITKQAIHEGFEYSYYSAHLINNEECGLYHLMFDFSKNML